MHNMTSPAARQRLHRRTVRIVILSQVFGGAGLAAGVTVGALLAQDLLGTDRYAGLPSSLFTLGSAAAAFAVGRLSQRFGRRYGLATGFLTGAFGACGVIAAAFLHNVPLLFASLLVYGAGTATNLQARYASTDLALPDQRAKAVSMAMVFTTLGAVAGPNLVTVMGHLALGWGLPELAGPFVLAAAAFLLAGFVFLLLLKPDPLFVAQTLAAAAPPDSAGATPDTDTDRRAILVGAAVMVLAQMIMVAIMTMTPVHMRHYDHGLGAIGMVIGIHVAAMYLPSPLTGWLTDKFGRAAMSYAAAVTLLLSGLLAAFAPGDSVVLLTVAFALLGLGWNFGLISGTTTIVDATAPDARAKVQGAIDVFIALAGASGGALSGVIVAAWSFATLSVGGGALALLLVPIVIWSARQQRIARSTLTAD